MVNVLKVPLFHAGCAAPNGSAMGLQRVAGFLHFKSSSFLQGSNSSSCCEDGVGETVAEGVKVTYHPVSHPLAQPCIGLLS